MGKVYNDFDLNLMVAKLVLDWDRLELEPQKPEQKCVHWADGYNWYEFDPCNNWKEVGKLIEEAKINLNFMDPRWQAWAMGNGPTSKEHHSTNQKRAAVVVYLMVKGVL